VNVLEALQASLARAKKPVSVSGAVTAMPAAEHQDAVQRLAEVPGLGVDSAHQIIAEVGAAAAAFPSMVAKASEFSDHSCCASSSRFLAHSRTPFVVTQTLMQNLPDQPAETMGDCPDGLFETEARQQPPKHNLEDATLDFDCGVGGLIQKTPHEAVTLRRSVTRRDSGALFFAGAYPNPRGEVLAQRIRDLVVQFGPSVFRLILNSEVE
jgi:hypothetical protein